MANPPSPALTKLAAAVRRYRKLRGHTQAQLAALIPCSDKTISAIETGRDRPSREMIVAVEAALGLPPRRISRSVRPARHREPAQLDARLGGRRA